MIALFCVTVSFGQNRAFNVPFHMGFEDDDINSAWIINDANADGKTWERIHSDGNLAPCCMKYHYNFAQNADDWLISPEITLEDGKTYVISIAAKQLSATNHESFKIWMGRGSSLGSLTTEVISVTEGEITKKYQYFKAPVTIYSSGSYNFGIQVTSGTDAFELFVDDFEVY